jgi:hypothetical protein
VSTETEQEQLDLTIAGGMLAAYTGSCPADSEGWEHPDGCYNTCTEDCEARCWALYIREQAGNMILEEQQNRALNKAESLQQGVN